MFHTHWKNNGGEKKEDIVVFRFQDKAGHVKTLHCTGLSPPGNEYITATPDHHREISEGIEST